MGILKKIAGFIKKIFGPKNLSFKVTYVWDREGLRNFLVTSADKLKNSLAWRWLNDQEKAANRAGRAFWAKNDSVTNAALDDFARLMNG